MAQELQQESVCQANMNNIMISKDSIEYRVLLSYALKNGTANIQTEPSDKTLPTKPRKKKKKYRLLKFISCVRSTKGEDHRRRPAAVSSPDQQDVDKIVKKLSKMTDSVHYTPAEFETDGSDLVDQIVELLREHGDKLNEKIEKDHILKEQLQASMNYGFFEKVAKAFHRRLTPEERPPIHSPKQMDIAITCDLTVRLSALDRHPMNRVLGFGARYLQDYFSPWVNQHGGYENVFQDDDDDDDGEEVH